MKVTPADRRRLEAIVGDRNAPQKHVWRAKIILATADGCGTAEIMRRSGKSKPVVWRWQERFMAEGVDGLTARQDAQARQAAAAGSHRAAGGRSGARAAAGRGDALDRPALAKAAGVSLRSVQRIWRPTASPHRVRTFKLSNDPKFAEKLKDVVGLYVDPPAHAVVLSVDEKSQIQALDRTQPGLPMKPGRAGTMTHDYKRHGTTTLFAALNVLDGTVIGRYMQRHRHQEFIRFLNAIEAAGAGRKGDPRHRRQLRHPQASQGARLARAASALDLPLHADLRHPGSTPSRASSPRSRDGASSAASSDPSTNSKTPSTASSPRQTAVQTLRLDRRSTPRPRRRQTRETSVRVGARYQSRGSDEA